MDTHNLPRASEILNGTDIEVHSLTESEMYALTQACIYEISTENTTEQVENFLRFVMANMTPEYAIHAAKELYRTKSDISDEWLSTQTLVDFSVKYAYLLDEVK